MLVIDIGNSRIKWGRCDGAQLLESAAHAYAPDAIEQVLDDAWCKIENPVSVMLVCVAGKAVENAVQSWLRAHWQLEARVFQVSHRCGDLEHGYKDPAQHGADRWAAIIAARSMYRVPLCVISCGTAVTIDVIAADGKHLGGQIIPGADLSIAALAQRLPVLSNIEVIELSSADPVFATDTHAAVNLGVHNMLSAALDRAADNARAITGDDMKTLLTGGGATAMMALMKSSVELQPDLVLRGLCIAAQAEDA